MPYPALVLAISAAMLVLPACSTEEVRPDVIIPDYGPSAGSRRAADRVCAPGAQPRGAAAANARRRIGEPASPATCTAMRAARVDVRGRDTCNRCTVGEATTRSASATSPLARTISRSEPIWAGPTVFAGDGEIPAGSMAQLYLFGPPGAVQGRFVSYPASVAPGTIARRPDQPGPQRSEHRGGGLHGHGREPLRAFVVANRDWGRSSPATFADATVPDPGSGPTRQYVLSNGAALGYRQVPTPAVPIPPVQPVTHLAGRSSWTPGMTLGGDARLHGGAHLHVAHRRPAGIVVGKVSGGSFLSPPRPTNKGEELEMTNSLRWCPALFVGAAWLGLAACSTQEISADPVLIPGFAPSADHGELMISFAPSEVSFEEQQANAAAHDDCSTRSSTASRSRGRLTSTDRCSHSWSTRGRYPASATSRQGSHHFEIRAAGGGPTVFAGDGEIAAGSTTQLYLFGPAGAVQGRFVSYPTVVAAGHGARHPDQPDSDRPEPRGGGLRRREPLHAAVAAARARRDLRCRLPDGRHAGLAERAVHRLQRRRAGIPPGPDRRGVRPARAAAVPRGMSFDASIGAEHDPGRRRPSTCRPPATSRRPSRRPADTTPSPTIGGVPWYGLAANEPHSSQGAAERQQDRDRLLRRPRHALRGGLAGAQGARGLRLHRRPGPARRGDARRTSRRSPSSTAPRRRAWSTAARRWCARG